jgi:hypothetical protein
MLNLRPKTASSMHPVGRALPSYQKVHQPSSQQQKFVGAICFVIGLCMIGVNSQSPPVPTHVPGGN